MGLTIHYGLTSQTRSTARAKALVERIRQLALDLPFEHVDEAVRHLGPDVCQRPLDDLRPDRALFSAVLDGCKHVPIPWHRSQSASVNVQPLEIFSFDTIPGPGSEWASFGLARYPKEIEVTYRPTSDDRFIKTIKDGGSTRWQFDWERWRRWLQRNGHKRWEFPEDEKFQQKTQDQDRPCFHLAVLDLLQDPVCQRSGVRRHCELRQVPPVRNPSSRPNRPTAQHEGRIQRRGEVWAVLLYG